MSQPLSLICNMRLIAAYLTGLLGELTIYGQFEKEKQEEKELSRKEDFLRIALDAESNRRTQSISN